MYLAEKRGKRITEATAERNESEKMAAISVKTYTHTVHKPGIAAGQITLAFLSDFHNGHKQVETEVLTALQTVSPDLVVIGGDMLVGKPDVSFAPALSLVAKVADLYPTIYAYGNHEYRMCIYPETYKGAGAAYQKALEKLPLTLLRNSRTVTEYNDMSVCFTGLEIPAVNYKKWRKVPFPMETMETLVGQPEKGAVNILLAHNPLYVDTYFDWGADLVLAGHMHGGIVRLFGRPVIGTDGRLFPSYGYGRIDRGEQTMLVSAGLGEHTVPLRLFNPRELVIVQLENRP